METSKKQRKHFDNRQKVQALKRHFVEGVAISAICDELGIRVSQFYQWQGQLFEGGERAFDRSEGDQVKVLKNQIENLGVFQKRCFSGSRGRPPACPGP
jgi:transposase-like protein